MKITVLENNSNKHYLSIEGNDQFHGISFIHQREHSYPPFLQIQLQTNGIYREAIKKEFKDAGIRFSEHSPSLILRYSQQLPKALDILGCDLNSKQEILNHFAEAKKQEPKYFMVPTEEQYLPTTGLILALPHPYGTLRGPEPMAILVVSNYAEGNSVLKKLQAAKIQTDPTSYDANHIKLIHRDDLHSALQALDLHQTAEMLPKYLAAADAFIKEHTPPNPARVGGGKVVPLSLNRQHTLGK